ncbi:hypothetical protein ANO11243_039720 [Dothideomycetidae sp. 11243]|nr:hypothetical protein ANO11243_039720 [fungal sp. No.11243]
MNSDQSLTSSASALPSRIVIIGAGVFGLSTALALAGRSPAAHVTVVDRLTPPVPDGSSVDTTRVIRADYADPIYARLAKEAQAKLENDPEIKPLMFRNGVTFVCDGQPSRFTDLWKTQRSHAKAIHASDQIVELVDRDAVFQRIHGQDACPPKAETLVGGATKWNIGYCNLRNSFIDARAAIQVYYERCLQRGSISFRCGSAVDHIVVEDGTSKGVKLMDDTVLKADLVIVAAGAWSNRLVHLDQRVYPIAHEVAWIKVTAEEEQRWAHMPITTNLSTGLNMFPPYKGEIKILRRSPGYKNTVRVPHPEDDLRTISISYPRTMVTNPGDVIPLEAERELRENLCEIMPDLATRPFDRTKLCWISTTPTADFLIAHHPRVSGIHMATGGSAHAWKFLPTIGDMVVNSVLGQLPEELKEKWKWDKAGGGDGNAPRVDGSPVELSEAVRHHL